VPADVKRLSTSYTSEDILRMCVHKQNAHVNSRMQPSTQCDWRDWLVMNIFCERKHSESGYGPAASAVLRVLHFEMYIGARSLFALRFSASNGAIIPLPTSYAPSPPSPFLLFLASSALFSIQETWLQPAYFMRPVSDRVPIHPTKPSIHPSIHDESVRRWL